MKSMFIKLFKEALRAGIAAALAAVGLSATGCASVPMFVF